MTFKNSVPRRLGNKVARHLGQLVEHIQNWVEAYVWVPLVLFSIYGAAKLSYILTGRVPQENADWLVDYSSKAVLAVLIVLFTSILKQAGSVFWSKEERKAHPFLSVCADIFTFGIACMWCWFFSR